MNDKHLEQARETLDLARTDGLFSAAIKKGDALSDKRYSEEDIKTQRIVIGFGNLHVKTATAKMAAIRLLGYKESIAATAKAVKRQFKKK